MSSLDPGLNTYKQMRDFKSAARRLAIRLLRRFNPGDIRIRHHWTGQPFTLHSFLHKGYWFHGKNREKRTMERCAQLIRPDDAIVELGGHIGYLTAYFADLVPKGQVSVFEPTEASRRYLQKNTGSAPNVEIVPAAVADRTGEVTLYLDALTGQNASIVPDYRVAKANRARAGFDEVEAQTVAVPCTTLDAFTADRELRVDFLKIDVEGAELAALRGAQRVLSEHRPVILIEVTEERAEVFAIFRAHAYRLFTPTGEEIKSPGDLRVNVFAIHEADPRLPVLGGTAPRLRL